MQKSHLPLCVFGLFLILTIPLSFNEFSLDFATSVIPGWHTTIFPPYFLINTIIFIVMLFVVMAYWKISKRTKEVNWTNFFIHLVLTIPAIFYIAKPYVIDNLLIQQSEILSSQTIVSLMIAPYVLFMVGQVLFFTYFIRSITRTLAK